MRFMVDQLKTYQMFNSYKLHFKQKSYSVKKYGLSPNRFTQLQLDKKNDKYIYKRVGDQCQFDDQLSELISGNLLFNPNIWIGDLLDDDAMKRYKKVRSVRQSISHYTVEDTKYLIRTHGSLVNALKTGNIVHDIMSGAINPETYVMLNRIFGISDIVRSHNSNVITDTVVDRLEKYDSFITVESIDIYDKIKHNIRTFIENK